MRTLRPVVMVARVVMVGMVGAGGLEEPFISQPRPTRPVAGYEV